MVQQSFETVVGVHQERERPARSISFSGSPGVGTFLRAVRLGGRELRGRRRGRLGCPAGELVARSAGERQHDRKHAGDAHRSDPARANQQGSLAPRLRDGSEGDAIGPVLVRWLAYTRRAIAMSQAVGVPRPLGRAGRPRR